MAKTRHLEITLHPVSCRGIPVTCITSWPRTYRCLSSAATHLGPLFTSELLIYLEVDKGCVFSSDSWNAVTGVRLVEDTVHKAYREWAFQRCRTAEINVDSCTFLAWPKRCLLQLYCNTHVCVNSEQFTFSLWSKNWPLYWGTAESCGRVNMGFIFNKWVTNVNTEYFGSLVKMLSQIFLFTWQ